MVFTNTFSKMKNSKVNLKVDKPSISEIFRVMSANDTIEQARKEKNPKKLYGDYWFEDEVCCLFSDANTGKSILAVQIGNEIAKTLSGDEKVLYYDFELSRKQFELRYTSNDKAFRFSDNFIRVDLNDREEDLANYSASIGVPLDELIMEGIEANISANNAKVVIVDNISWLVNMKNTSTTASKLMIKLKNFSKKYGISILVLSHTPKRNLGKPITQNDMSGSKAFPNFFDSIFAIGKSIVNPEIRYLKQIKVRSAKFTHDSDNVELFKIAKENSFLGYKKVGESGEYEQLKSSGKKDDSKQAKKPAKKTAKATKKQAKVGVAGHLNKIRDILNDDFFSVKKKKRKKTLNWP